MNQTIKTNRKNHHTSYNYSQILRIYFFYSTEKNFVQIALNSDFLINFITPEMYSSKY